MHLSRRSLLKAALSVLALPSAPLRAAAQLKIPLGFDNFSVRALDLNAHQLIDYAASLHVDALFLSDLDCFPSLEDQTLSQIKAHAEASDLRLYLGSWSICPSSLRFKNNWGSAEQHLHTGIRVAKSLGSPIFRVILGTLEDRKTPGGIHARIADTLAVLEACKDDALDAGIKIAIENHAGDMHSWELADFVKKAGPDFVGVNFDSGNAAWTLEEPNDAFDRLAPYTVCTSLRDSMVWETEKGASVQWTAIGEGLVDWERMTQKLETACPNVPFFIETISGFSKTFAHKTDEFWQHYDKRTEVLQKFDSMARRGKPLEPFQPGPDRKSAEQIYQKNQLEKSLTFCREKLGLGLRHA